MLVDIHGVGGVDDGRLGVDNEAHSVGGALSGGGIALTLPVEMESVAVSLWVVVSKAQCIVPYLRWCN